MSATRAAKLVVDDGARASRNAWAGAKPAVLGPGGEKLVSLIQSPYYFSNLRELLCPCRSGVAAADSRARKPQVPSY